MAEIKAHCSILPPVHDFHRMAQLILSIKPIKPSLPDPPISRRDFEVHSSAQVTWKKQSPS